MIKSTIQLAYQSLLRQRRRSILTMLAIAIGIGSVVAIMAAGKGVDGLVLGQLEAFSPDSVWVEVKVPNVKKTSTSNAFGQASGITITTLNDKDMKAILDHPNINYVSGWVSGQEIVNYDGEIKKIMLLGKGADAPQIEKTPIAQGHFFTREEEMSLASVAVLGASAKNNLFGDEIAVGKTVYIRGKPFKVVGVLDSLGSAFFFDMDNVVVLPTKVMQKKLLGTDYVQAIMAKMINPALHLQTAKELTEIMRENHNIPDPDRDDFAVSTSQEARELLGSVTGGMTLLLVALVFISLLVGGVGIMNIMYVSVIERTFEIGLRRAVGASAKSILNQFLVESILVTVGGGVVGVVLGALIALLIYLLATKAGLDWIYNISAGSIILAVGFSAFIGFLFGIYPAKKAASLNPIEALRKE